MANVPAPKPRAEDFTSYGTGEESPSGEHRLSNTAATILVIWAVILDIADYLGAGTIFLTDILCVLTIDLYLLYKGFSPVRMFGGQALELIPVVGDALPAYTGGIIFTILQDRSKVVAAAASVAPKPSAASARFAGTATQAASRFRDVASKAIATTERQVERLQKLQDRIPGQLRSAPPDSQTQQERGARALGTTRRLGSGPAERAGWTSTTTKPSTTATAGAPPMPDTRDLADRPFPDTYYAYERELLPELEDVVDIDVTGERAAHPSPPPPPAN